MLKKTIYLLIVIFANSCAYKFLYNQQSDIIGDSDSKVYVAPSVNLSTSPLDLSKVQSVWEQELAKNSSLRLSTHAEGADLFLQVFVHDERTHPSGTLLLIGPDKDVPFDETAVTELNRFQNLNLAKRFSDSSTTQIKVHVNLYDKKKKSVIFSRTFSDSKTFKNIQLADTNKQFIQYFEVRELAIQKIFRSMAQKFFLDLAID